LLRNKLDTVETGTIALLSSAQETQDIVRTLEAQGISSMSLDGGQLPEALEQGRLAAAIIGAELLPHLDISAIGALMRERTSGAAFPFVLIVDRQHSYDLQSIQAELGNLLLLERPLVPSFLVNCARAALHAHALAPRPEEHFRLSGTDGERLRHNMERLEKGVGQRMRELASANERLRRDAAELRRLQAQLIHVSRLSAMGTIASTLAHELNQPLTAISSYISGSRRLLSDPEAPHDQALEALLAAEAAALRGGEILRRLREFVSRGTVSVKPEKLDRLVAEACELGFVDQHLLGVSHRVELDRSCGWVAADRIQVQQVLINLFRNAVQAVRGVPHREVAITSAPAEGGMVEISVSDTGPGISSEVRETLFTAFQSTKPDGMGIGLSISRTIVEAHGGRIWTEDCASGAVFRFTLPCAEPAASGNPLDQP
jgi:C4-dicarboxylate-specific signal transduction histidine kinase